MRPSSFFVALTVITGCSAITDGGTHISPISASWVEWPSEARASEPFEIRFVGFLPACGATYVRSRDVTNHTIDFHPLSFVPDEPRCENIVPPMFDDRIAFTLAPGTYEIRSGGQVFGLVVVSMDPGAGRVNAAGFGGAARDQQSCLRLRPVVIPAVRELPIENPEAAGTGSGFVTGYLADVIAPLCGETRVFHLVAAN